MQPLSLLLLLSLPLLILCADDYYKLLNLDKQASDREIKKAYRELSKQYHPDKNPYTFLFLFPPNTLPPLSISSLSS